MSRFVDINPIFADILTAATPHVPSAPAPVAPPAPAPVPGVTIVQSAKESAEAEQAFAREILGVAIDPAQQFFATGTKMLACGEETLRSMRLDWEDLPLVGDACHSLVRRIRDEERQDLAVDLSAYRIDSRGLLTSGDLTSRLRLSDRAYSGLVSRAPRDSVARNVNSWIGYAGPAKIRTRYPQEDGTRHAYAVVSTRYAPIDLDTIAQIVADAMPTEARASIAYDGSRGTIDVSLAKALTVEEMGVGQVFRVHTLIDTADDGSAAFRASYQAERVRCINCTTITDKRAILTRKHIGNVTEVRALVRDALAGAGAAMDLFADRWRAASIKRYTCADDGSDLPVAETFRRLIAAGLVKSAGTSARDTFDRLMVAYEREPMSGLIGINAAITRAAHEAAWASPWARRDLEDQAGALLWARHQVLAPIDPETSDRLFAA